MPYSTTYFTYWYKLSLTHTFSKPHRLYFHIQNLKLAKIGWIIVWLFPYKHSLLIFQAREDTVWKVSKYGVFSGPYFPLLDSKWIQIFSPSTEKYRPEKTPYLDTFHAVGQSQTMVVITKIVYKNKCNKILNSSVKYAVYVKMYYFQHVEHQISTVFSSLLKKNLSITVNSPNANFTVLTKFIEWVH